MSGVWDAVTGLLGLGDPSGNDHGSSNWAAWGHKEIRSMLDHSVDPGDIGEGAQAWREQARTDAAIVTGLTRDLQQTVAGGWRGAAAEAALNPLGAIETWSASHTDTADHTTRLMEDSGSAAAQAKSSVPPPKSHSWMESLAVTALTGPVGGFTDAVLQEKAQSDAHAEAVRIMTNVYSAPINDHRAAVPTYLQLADPTLPPPDQAPAAGPALATPYSAPGGPTAVAGPTGSGHLTHPPTVAALQGVTSDSRAHLVPPAKSQPPPGQPVGQPPPETGGGVAAAAAVAGVGLPGTVPSTGAGTVRRSPAAGSEPLLGGGRAAGSHPPGGTHVGSVGRSTLGHSGEFGPRPSSAPAEAAEGRLGSLGRGGATPAAGRTGMGGLMPPMAAGGGSRGEDSEHRRPSYLIEMDDVFADGRKVAPPVIGDDPAAHGGHE